LLIILPGTFESLFAKVQVRFWEGDAMLGLLLEGVEDVYDS
jgi:hypothetical protein